MKHIFCGNPGETYFATSDIGWVVGHSYIVYGPLLAGMANNLTGQVRNIAEVTTAVAQGDLSKKITVDVRGEILQLKEAINTMSCARRSTAS